MSDYITLECGCKINPTTVVAMCIAHYQQFHCQQVQRQGEYANWVQRMTDLAHSPSRTNPEPT